MSLRVGIAGLGRVGRGLLRTHFSSSPTGRFDIRVVCDVMSLEQVAYLLAHDSTYGKLPVPVDCDGDFLVLGDRRIRYERVDRRRQRSDGDSSGVLRGQDLDVLVDATGTAKIEDLRAVIKQGVARKALSTWNVEGSDLSIVYGVNHRAYDPRRHHVVSASTCTGNALVPVLWPIEQHIGIDRARVITIHPVLSDQRALDGYHAASHLGRAYNHSIIPTATAVAHSTVLVLPSLAGKLDSLSYRVPTDIVSAIDLTVTLARDSSREECVDLLESYARESLRGIIHCDHGSFGQQRASIEFAGSEYSAHILMKHLVLNGPRQLGLSIMHDNEWAYCSRVLDVLDVLAE